MAGGEDVLDKALEMNSAKYAPPSTKWRTGHVSKAKLAPAAIRI
jgi:hypothetical protein